MEGFFPHIVGVREMILGCTIHFQPRLGLHQCTYFLAMPAAALIKSGTGNKVSNLIERGVSF